MKAVRTIALSLFFAWGAFTAQAQDIVEISPGNFIRGTIQATNFATVVIKNDDESMVQYKAGDIQQFVWNGETYVSKPIVIRKKMEQRFFKVIELGTVNLYAMGGNTLGVEAPQPRKRRFSPSIGIGAGSGGFGGVGVGGGISIGGGGRSQDTPVKQILPSTYFLEKFGSGPMLELPIEATNIEARNQQIKNALLQKMTNDDDLAQRIKSTENFDAKVVQAFVSAYNAAHK